MTGYKSQRHKRPGSKVYTNSRQTASDDGISGESAQTDGDGEADDPTPDADDSGDGCDPDPPATGGENARDSDDEPAWKEYGYPRKPEWAPDCPKCGGPIIGITVSGPMTSEITPCGCKVLPASVDII